MLIRCPTCASGYELAPELLPEGRILRCAHCRDAWVHAGPPPAGLRGPEIVAETRFSRRAEPEATRRPPARPRTSARAGLPPWAGSAASLALALLVVGGGMGAVAAKARLVEAFPPSAAVFAALGLPVNLTGLGLADMRSTVVSGDGGSTLTLEGHITNLTPAPVAVPPLRIAVRDKSRRELYYWTAPAPKAQLAVGETVLFRSRLAAPPRDGQDLAVSFAEPSAGPRRGPEVLAGR